MLKIKFKQAISVAIVLSLLVKVPIEAFADQLIPFDGAPQGLNAAFTSPLANSLVDSTNSFSMKSIESRVSSIITSKNESSESTHRTLNGDYHGKCGPSTEYDFNTDTGTLTISASISGKVTSNPWSSYKSEIKSVIFKCEKMDSLCENAFSDCTGLVSVTFPEFSVDSIGANAFSGCTGLTSVTLPHGIGSIGADAFSGCLGLKNVTISTVKGTFSTTVPPFTIGDNSFSNCPQLVDFYCYREEVPSFEGNPFEGSDSLNVVKVPVNYEGTSFCGKDVDKVLDPPGPGPEPEPSTTLNRDLVIAVVAAEISAIVAGVGAVVAAIAGVACCYIKRCLCFARRKPKADAYHKMVTV